MNVNCAHCNTELERMPSQIKKSKSGTFFCNKSCSASFNNKGVRRNYTDGSGSYRIRAIREFGAICNRCEYKEYEKVLQVHHKDHNRNNNETCNLEVLCPTCHSVEHLVKYKNNSDKPVNEDLKIT